MFVRDAKAKCPDLEIVPYNFEAYEQVRKSVMHHKRNNDFHYLFKFGIRHLRNKSVFWFI